MKTVFFQTVGTPIHEKAKNVFVRVGRDKDNLLISIMQFDEVGVVGQTLSSELPLEVLNVEGDAALAQK
jgi:hypothetical protein